MKRSGLAARLSVLIMAATLGTAAALGVSAAIVGNRSLSDSVRSDLVELVNYYADSIDLYFSGARALLAATAPDVARSAAGPRPDLRAVRETARQTLAAGTSFEYVALVDAQGVIRVIEPMLSLSRPDVGFSDWFSAVREKRVPVMSDLLVSVATQRPSVVIAVPLLDGRGTFQGAWIGGLQLGRLSSFALGRGRGGAEAYGYVTDSRGLIVAHQARPGFVLAQTDYSGVPTVREALLGRRGTIEYVSSADGKAKLGAYLPLRAGRPAGDPPWAVAYVTPVASAFRPVRVITLTLGALALLFGAALALLGAVTIQRALLPVGRLASAAREMGEGNLSVRAPGGMRYELAELAASFNLMAASVEASQERLAARALELEQSTMQLRAANQELEAFSYSVSHDLRAPLRSIDGFSKAILEDYQDRLDDEGKEYLGFLRDAAQKMGRLIDDMLALSRVTRAELVWDEVDLSAAAAEIGRDLARDDPSRRVRLEVPPGLVVRGDAVLLRTMLQNLLDNAWKFTRGRDPAVIELGRLEEENGSRHFYVRDNGVGFDMQYAGKLFKPFERLHTPKEFEGTGIGLVTVKRILARHGGHAWIESEPGKGTTVHFALEEGRMA